MAKHKNYEDSHFEEYLETQKIVDIDIEKRMKEAFIDYAMSVIVSRALPDVRDGLKPVHRRILYSMYEEHLTHDKPFFKSATTVGNAIGRYHPHGDASVYDAMVRLAQDFSMRYMLIDGHGNFGSIDGDSPAAYRYTEARMSRIANLMLENIDKNTVDFAPNFDEKRQEPVVLPTRIPTLLINGSSGIAVGMATNIPPHNLTEVLDGVIAQIDNPDITVEELMEYIKGPDFPTKASIMGRRGIKDAYETGKGKVIVRAKTEIEEHSDGTSAIIVTELPYQVNKKMLVESIAQLAKDKRIEGISDIDDHSSDRVGIRVEISVKRDANPQVVFRKSVPPHQVLPVVLPPAHMPRLRRRFPAEIPVSLRVFPGRTIHQHLFPLHVDDLLKAVRISREESICAIVIAGRKHRHLRPVFRQLIVHRVPGIQIGHRISPAFQIGPQQTDAVNFPVSNFINEQEIDVPDD